MSIAKLEGAGVGIAEVNGRLAAASPKDRDETRLVRRRRVFVMRTMPSPRAFRLPPPSFRPHPPDYVYPTPPGKWLPPEWKPDPISRPGKAPPLVPFKPRLPPRPPHRRRKP